MGRFLLLCFLSVIIAVSGPVARGVAAQAAPPLETVDLSWSGAGHIPEAGGASHVRCPGGVAARSACTLDPGPAPDPQNPITAGAGKRFAPLLDGTSGDLLRSRLFRPPRSG